MATLTLNPKEHILLVGENLENIEGWKSCQITFPNDSATIQNNADGSHTFVEHVQDKQFEATIQVDSAQAGGTSLNVYWLADSLVPFTFTNLQGLKIVECLKARVMLKSMGMDDGGNDTPSEFKIIGVADFVNAGGQIV